MRSSFSRKSGNARPSAVRPGKKSSFSKRDVSRAVYYSALVLGEVAGCDLLSSEEEIISRVSGLAESKGEPVPRLVVRAVVGALVLGITASMAATHDD